MKKLFLGLILSFLIAMPVFGALHVHTVNYERVWYDGTENIFWIRNASEGLRIGDDLPFHYGDEDDSYIKYVSATDTLQISATTIELTGGNFVVDGPTVFDTTTAQTITAASDTITIADTLEEISSDAAHTLASTPTIADGTKGQIVYLMEVGSGSVILQDEATLPGSNLQLGAATRTIDAYDVLQLIFDGTYWIEVSYTNN